MIKEGIEDTRGVRVESRRRDIWEKSKYMKAGGVAEVRVDMISFYLLDAFPRLFFAPGQSVFFDDVAFFRNATNFGKTPASF